MKILRRNFFENSNHVRISVTFKTIFCSKKYISFNLIDSREIFFLVLGIAFIVNIIVDGEYYDQVLETIEDVDTLVSTIEEATGLSVAEITISEAISKHTFIFSKINTLPSRSVTLSRKDHDPDQDQPKRSQSVSFKVEYFEPSKKNNWQKNCH